MWPPPISFPSMWRYRSFANISLIRVRDVVRWSRLVAPDIAAKLHAAS